MAQHSLDNETPKCDTSRCQESWRNTWVEQVMTCTYYHPAIAIAISSTYVCLNISSWQIIFSRKLLMLIPSLQIVHNHQSSANPASTSIEIFHIGRKCTKLLASLHLFLIITHLPPPIQIAPAPETPPLPVETPKTHGPSCNHVRATFTPHLGLPAISLPGILTVRQL